MKTYIYFLIVSLIVLCSCKSNSFLKQRYTHLPQTHHKTPESKLAKHETPAKRRELKNDAGTKNEEPVSYASFAGIERATTEQAAAPAKTSVYKKITRPVFSTGAKMLSIAKTEVEKSQTKSIGENKTFKQKMHSAMGVISGLFKIILFAIILAILVAVIIIIVLT